MVVPCGSAYIHTCNCLCPSFFCSIYYNNYFLVTAMLLNGNQYENHCDNLLGI